MEWTQGTEVTPTSTSVNSADYGTGYRFGSDIALSGDGLVLAVVGRDDGTDFDSPTAYIHIYDLVDSVWVLRDPIIPADLVQNFTDLFLDLDYTGSTVVVGGSVANEVAVYTWSEGSWSTTSISLSGTYIYDVAINVSGDMICLRYGTNYLRVFSLSGSTWSDLCWLSISSYNEPNMVSFDSTGTKLIIQTGEAEYEARQWTGLNYTATSTFLDISAPSGVYQFGVINNFNSDNTIWATHCYDSNESQYAIYVYFYNTSTTAWELLGRIYLDPAATIEGFASSIAVNEDGTKIYVGNINYDTETYTNLGAFYTFTGEEEEEEEETTISISGTVKEGSVNIARTVRAYNRSTGELLGTTTSDATTGAYTISDLPSTATVYLVCLDDDEGTLYNSLIHDRLIPVSS